MRFEIGTAVLLLAMSGATQAAAQAPSTEDQMRAGFDVCADFAAGRLDLATAEATANGLGFSGGGDGRMLGWPGQGAQARIRL
ncbi:MAG: hypothetical protein KAY20_04740, partial [Brevundimonas sp.]|nr:hypothetical protein [Brevundimonas sp.]